MPPPAPLPHLTSQLSIAHADTRSLFFLFPKYDNIYIPNGPAERLQAV